MLTTDHRGAQKDLHYPTPWERLAVLLRDDKSKDESEADRACALESGSFSDRDTWQAIYEVMESQIYFFWPECELGEVFSDREIELARRMLVDSGVSSTWSTPFNPGQQNLVSIPGAGEPPVPPALSEHDPHQSLVEFMREAQDEAGGAWWTGPTGPGLEETSGHQPGIPATQLLGDEDDAGHESAYVLPAVGAERDLNIYEVDAREDWLALLAMAPVNVTKSRQEYWGRWEPHCRWEMPDWAALSSTFDGVHLTVNGYLQLSCSPLATPSGARTLIAGWGPDVTYWLRKPALQWGTPFKVRRVAEAQWVHSV